MKAVQITEFGGPDVLKLVDLPQPEPGIGEVRIRVKACAVNRRDVWVRSGLRNRTLPRILGCDIAGTVEAVGDERDAAWIGRNVAVYPVIGCGTCAACAAGAPNLCNAAGLLGAEADGGYAEAIVVDTRSVTATTDRLGFAETAALPVVYTTAWQLIRRARIAPGESVLVWGASGGLGRACLELCRLLSPGLLVTTARADKADALPHGLADQTIAYDRETVSDAVLELTDGRGVDVVIDHVGSSTWDASFAMLARGGRLAIGGATTGNEVALPLLPFLVRGLEVIGCFVGTRADFDHVIRLAGAGLVTPTVDAVPLADARLAHERLESGDSVGKLVLVP